MIKAKLPGKRKGIKSLTGCMAPADDFQNVIIESLWVNAYPVGAAVFDGKQLFPVYCVGTSGLNGKFAAGAHVKAAP